MRLVRGQRRRRRARRGARRGRSRRGSFSGRSSSSRAARARGCARSTAACSSRVAASRGRGASSPARTCPTRRRVGVPALPAAARDVRGVARHTVAPARGRGPRWSTREPCRRSARLSCRRSRAAARRRSRTTRSRELTRGRRAQRRADLLTLEDLGAVRPIARRCRPSPSLGRVGRPLLGAPLARAGRRSTAPTTHVVVAGRRARHGGRRPATRCAVEGVQVAALGVVAPQRRGPVLRGRARARPARPRDCGMSHRAPRPPARRRGRPGARRRRSCRRRRALLASLLEALLRSMATLGDSVWRKDAPSRSFAPPRRGVHRQRRTALAFASRKAREGAAVQTRSSLMP